MRSIDQYEQQYKSEQQFRVYFYGLKKEEGSKISGLIKSTLFHVSPNQNRSIR